MKPNAVDQAEFIGGPEDGRIVDRTSLPLLRVSDDDEGVREIPMFILIDEDLDLQDGDELELILIGQYVCEETGGERLKYRWVD
jgi:hypothetical protein